MTLLGMITGDRTTQQFFSAYRSFWADPLSYARLIGHGGLVHFMGNAMSPVSAGTHAGGKYGSNTLLKVILAAAVFTGIIHCALWSNVMLCGASGVVFACIILSSFTAFKNGEIPLTFVLIAAIYIGQEIYNGVFVQDNISNLTHILGGVVGSVYGYLLNKK